MAAAAAFSYSLFLIISFIMIFPMFMPTTKVSAIRIHLNSTPSQGKMPAAAVDNVNLPQQSHDQNVFDALMKGRITPSGPSHRGHGAPTRHLLRKLDLLSFQGLKSVPSPGVGHR
ncbi:hypothetical protein COLO4_31232 [Corchorus olitorius]|uniref:Uncharacterized protein n=1 Tax=Corchorus olitorius TaxID=93759 RepID=A0A1R3H538_9ROSI|nr:hypothetical protein COLO4_31232 [Corchorus olitorius]